MKSSCWCKLLYFPVAQTLSLPHSLMHWEPLSKSLSSLKMSIQMMSFSEMGSSLHRLDADVLTTAVNTEQTRRLSQRVAWLLDSLLGRYGPELPSRALHATPSKTFPSGFLTTQTIWILWWLKQRKGSHTSPLKSTLCLNLTRTMKMVMSKMSLLI